ncbi:Putative glycan acetyltransferase [Nitrosococcus oceani ATCC 19707]|uniref:Glycan acetyltransferase n=2 Tax=Nitrosococcus oceani TaxID=1229 RepID=Q3J9P5_NITOC|nr:DapH/DapD/GlmU-related protein [Nitrosococcus oceani]ABA58451.1 Putative glycan acetyltransferase [Nitrosococcus oceani ATCC 19707]EDZ67865.1 Bacterial transferase hexapeptide repeat protein [Nitrosococcus oceani AFC27]KFI19053.1 transferase [Nitrosococcus oceani C-27]GEM18846.1 transferase [Nitrosococcus oceani]
MRKIGFSQIIIFLSFFTAALILGIGTAYLLLGGLELGDFRGIVLVVGALIFVYLYAIALYRLFLRLMPLQEGEIPEHSRQESIYHIYLLFYLLLFYPIMRSGLPPAPLMRVFYLALGARLGHNTYSQGIIHDPPFIQVGANTLIGQNTLLIPHVIEGKRLAHYPIQIGNNVTIGANAVLLAGVNVGDDAIVATGAVVPKGTQLGSGEVWGGVPARLLRPRQGRHPK